MAGSAVNVSSTGGPAGDGSEQVSILVVDDEPSKVLAMETILADLGENVVTASSGKDALRKLLGQHFAVILLDINMPVMDGFETAELIRMHPAFRLTPLIFVTAFSDELYAAKSYSLGAVDFILTPIVPEALRTKVKVFVDLFRSTERIRRQADALQLRAAQMQKLAAASMAINASPSLDQMLKAITDAARDVIGANLAIISAKIRGRLDLREGASSVLASSAMSSAPEYVEWRAYVPALIGSGLSRAVGDMSSVLRFGPAELEQHSDWHDGLPPMRSWMATSLSTVEGRFGTIQLIDKGDGVFTRDDEAILQQLSQMAAMSIQTYVHADAREANRVKDLFLATLSHELRTPLNVIQGWTRLLAEDPSDPETVRRGLVVIDRNVRSQMKLVEELLDVSRISSGKLRVELRDADLTPVVEAAVLAMRPAAEERDLTIESLLGKSPIWIGLDSDRMQQVFTNLLSNAIKFTPAGGHISVTVRDGEPDSPPSGNRDGASDWVEVVVTDTGVGISPDFLPLVFDRFRQADSSTRRKQGGLGLGLAVVRDIVERHGGNVRVESRGQDQGSSFIVRLPKSTGAQRDHSVGRLHDGPEASITGLDIVLVEDDYDTREIMSRLLARSGANVTSYASVEEGLDAIVRHPPNVIISDLAMPGRDGYDLIRELRGRSASEGGDLPALALSAHASAKERERALDAGFDRHAAKPIQTADLVAIVAELAAMPRATSSVTTH